MTPRSLLFAALCIFSLPSFSHILKLDTARLLQRTENCEGFAINKKFATQFAVDHKNGKITNYSRSLRLTVTNISVMNYAMSDTCRRGMLENQIEVLEYIRKEFPDSFSSTEDVRELAQAKFMYTVRFDSQYGYQYKDADRDLRESIAVADNDVSRHSDAYIFLAETHPPIAEDAYQRAVEVALDAYKRKSDGYLLIPFKRAQEKLIERASGNRRQELQKQLIDLMEADTEGHFHIDLAQYYSALANDAAAARHLDQYFAKERENYVDLYQRTAEQGRQAQITSIAKYCADSMRNFFVQHKPLAALQGRYDPEVLAKSVCTVANP
jgi:hypothetical protein